MDMSDIIFFIMLSMSGISRPSISIEEVGMPGKSRRLSNLQKHRSVEFQPIAGGIIPCCPLNPGEDDDDVTIEELDELLEE